MSAAVKEQQEKHFDTFQTKASTDGLPEGQIWFTASKETEDRDTDVVRVAGIKTTHFEANPVFLWAHDQSSPPIGKANQVKVVGDELQMLIEFDMKDPFAAMIYDKYKGGFLNAVSIGFMAFEQGVKKREKGGFEFVESELLELSSVPVPSNREALAFAREFAQYKMHPKVEEWAKGVLDAQEERNRKAVTDEEIDAAFEAKRSEAKAADLGIDLQVLDLHVELDDDEREFLVEAIKEVTGRTVHVSKAGRVLSASNFSKIEQATNTLQQVLDSARREEEEEEVEDKAAPAADDPQDEAGEVTYLFADEEVQDAGDGVATNEEGDDETTWSFE